MSESEGSLSCAGVAQLGEQQTEAPSILEVPCSIHGPGIFYRFPTPRLFSLSQMYLLCAKDKNLGPIQGVMYTVLHG